VRRSGVTGARGSRRVQVPDEEKRKRADHVVETACSLEETEAAVVKLIAVLLLHEADVGAEMPNL
jgi:dephospho-CoA kinase